MGVGTDNKVPLQLNGSFASSVDPNTWSDFDDIEKRVASGFFSYAGFVFNDDGYVGIDIDKGYNEDGTLSDLAFDIISHCHSYTERSKSLRGVHIILKGTLDTSGLNNLNGVEIYASRRYFVTTGDVYVYKNIIENQSAINYILDKYFSNLFQNKKENSIYKDKIYNMRHSVELSNGTLTIKKSYDDIEQGGRHMAILSAAGQYHQQGYSLEQIINKLEYINDKHCKPPLEHREICTIAKSVIKYERK